MSRKSKNQEVTETQDKEMLLQYSKELSLLSQLLQSKLITETEYQKIKMKLMNEYNIISDITAMTA